MAVKISSLWNKAEFITLTTKAKLLYIYLTNNTSINNVGVFSLDPEISAKTLNMELEEFKVATIELRNLEMIYVKKFGDIIYYVVPSHFSTVAKSEANLNKIRSELKSLPKGLVDYLASIGITTSAKQITFDKPTIEDIRKFSLSKGYNIDAKVFYDYYENASNNRGIKDYWVDSRGARIKNWQMKLQQVWFKDDRKFEVPKDAPEGFELFSVEVNGTAVYPDYWKDGRPMSKDFVTKRELNKEFDKIKNK